MGEFIFFLPQHPAVGNAKGQKYAAGRFRILAGHEHFVIPENRRAVASAGQFRLPVVILFCPFDGNRPGITYPLAIRAAEPRPLLPLSRAG